MAKQKQLSPKYQEWIDARKMHKLSHAHIQMARELGMNPKKFGKLDNHKQELWKAPLPIFAKDLSYNKKRMWISVYSWIPDHRYAMRRSSGMTLSPNCDTVSRSGMTAVVEFGE